MMSIKNDQFRTIKKKKKKKKDIMKWKFGIGICIFLS